MKLLLTGGSGNLGQTSWPSCSTGATHRAAVDPLGWVVDELAGAGPRHRRGTYRGTGSVACYATSSITSSSDSPLEGSEFELLVPRCALIANSPALVAPPDSAVSGGSLNGRLTTPIRQRGGD
jgi:hypothetical protein